MISSRRHGGSFVVLIVASCLLLGWIARPVVAYRFSGQVSQTQDREYFEETGFWVSGKFLDYFYSRGGLDIFGYPISSAYVNTSGILVQYFQKARMEWHPHNPEPYKVQLGLLGEELGFRRSPLDSAPSHSSRKVYFPETGHTVAYRFLDYFREHGGLDIFGYPITEMFIEDQRIVQYFQRMKLIWDPQATEMRVGDLGELHISVYRDHLPEGVLETQFSAQIGEEPLDLAVVIDVAYSVISSSREQEVTVVVLNDRTDQPLAGAQVQLRIQTESGEVYDETSRLLRTDENGRAHTKIALSGIAPGTYVTVDVQASFGEAEAQGRDLFLIWF